MSPEVIIAFLTMLVAILAIIYTNRNNTKQIRTGKLEELFQCIQSLSRNYGLFMEYWHLVHQLRDKDDKEIQTLADYYSLRDKKLTIEKRSEIIMLLSRIEVLSECYTDANLKEDLLRYEDLMYCFFDLVVNAGSISQELKYKNGFPTFEEFFKRTIDLKAQIVLEIKKY